MAGVITTLGHDPVGMKRATETALRQASNEIDRLERMISTIQAALAAQQAILDDHEARIVVLEP